MDDKYRKILNKYIRKFLHLRHVKGIGYGNKITDGRKTEEKSIVVMVDKKLPESQLSKSDIVPGKVDELKTDVQEIGKLELQKTARNKRFRPAPAGVSIGHYQISAGTLGAVVKDNKTGQPLILSNNHILANISDGHDRRASIGDPILQPGSYDKGNKENDVIGHLTRYIPLKPTKNLFNPVFNTVDCAVAEPVDIKAVDNSILGIGKIKDIKEPEVDMKVQKSGRTTGVTDGSIRAVDSVVNVSISENEEALFKDQIVTSPLSEAGDSGSLVLDTDNNAVGLLFAGSNEISVCNKITNVMKELNIDFFKNDNKEKENDSSKDDKINGQKKAGRNPFAIFLILLLLLPDFNKGRII